VVRAVPVLAAAAVAFTPASPAVRLAPGHTANSRVYARSGALLTLRASTSRCTRSLSITIDGRRPVTVRASRPTINYPVASLARGWHRVGVRASDSGCRGALVINWSLTGQPAVPAPTATAPKPTASPSIPPPDTPAPTPSQPIAAPPALLASPPPAPAAPPTLAPGPAAPPQIAGVANPFAAQHFYVDPNTNAAQTEAIWLAQGDAADANAMAKIAQNPQAQWFGDWNGSDPLAAVSSAVSRATTLGALPVLVAYDIPNRDCGGQSAGGAASPAAYQAWIDGFARGIGASHAVVILEPDALAELGCGNAAQQQTTLSLLSYAVQTLSANPGTSVYLDAGNAGWQPAGVIATRLQAAGVAQASGFSLNISNFDTNSSEETYGDSVSALVGGKHFVIDTSRNGQGVSPDGQWCNPPGRGLGLPATTNTGDLLADALFWIKPPGESDGTCNGGPAAGTWWQGYALGLAQNAAF
jgi:endoglucanase